MLRQCQFVAGNTHTAGFVEDDPRLKPGVEVTLKGDDRRWRVVKLGQATDRDKINRGWNNNI